MKQCSGNISKSTKHQTVIRPLKNPKDNLTLAFTEFDKAEELNKYFISISLVILDEVQSNLVILPPPPIAPLHPPPVIVPSPLIA